MPKTRFADSFIGNDNVLPGDAFAALVAEAPSDAAAAICPETIRLLPDEPQPDSYRLSSVICGFSPHGNVIRYTVGIGAPEFHADVLFRRITLFDPGPQVYALVEKRNSLVL